MVTCAGKKKNFGSAGENNIYYYREFIFQYFTHRWKQPEGKHFFPRAKPEGKNASPRAVSTCK